MASKKASPLKRKGIILFIVAVVLVFLNYIFSLLSGFLSLLWAEDSMTLLVFDILSVVVYVVALVFMVWGLVYMFKEHSRLKALKIPKRGKR